jgi:hypothetical protein
MKKMTIYVGPKTEKFLAATIAEYFEEDKIRLSEVDIVGAFILLGMKEFSSKQTKVPKPENYKD